MKVVLELQDQPSNIKKVTVRHDIVIGRGAECNLRLSAPQVSRRHCFLRIGADSATVADLESSNGTFLNGERLTSGKRHPLEDGARLAIGPVQFTVRVVPEVVATDLLEVSVNDARIQAEAANDQDKVADKESSQGAEFSGVPPEGDHSSMNFAIESGGPTADEDDPTTDYLAADALDDRSYFATDGSDGPDAPGSSATTSELDTITGKSDDLFREASDDGFELVDVDVPLIDEDDNVVPSASDDDATVNIPDEDGAPAAVDQQFLTIQEDDLLIVDDSVDVPSHPVQTDDDMEEDLRDFLKGLE